MSFVCLWIPAWRTGAVSLTAAGTGTRTASPAEPRPAVVPAADVATRDDGPADEPAERAALVAALLTLSPHVALESRDGPDGGALLWLDGRGLPARKVARAAVRLAREHGVAGARVGLARTAVAAEAAATVSDFVRGVAPAEKPSAVTIVPPGGDAAFLAPLPLAMLTRTVEEDSGANVARHGAGLIASLADVGLRRCDDLAQLTRAAVELRFGARGIALWQLARADATVSARRALTLFPPRRRALPSASLAWDDYAIRDLERLAFVVNRLAATVCDGLRAWGEGARALTVIVVLANRTTVECPVRAGRPTASRATWARLVRAALDRAELPDAVVGLALRVDAAGEAGAVQGDLFDRGFQAGHAVEEALAQLVDDRRATIVGLAATRHPLLEQRTQWRAQELAEVLRADDRRVAEMGPGWGRGGDGVGTESPSQVPSGDGMVASRPGTDRGRTGDGPRYHSIATPAPLRPHSLPGARSGATLALQLLPAPRPVRVTAERRRDHRVPVRFADAAPEIGRGGWAADAEVVTAAGPDHVAGHDEDGVPYAREYFHALTADGVLVLLFRDVAVRKESGGGWYVHGWWD